MKARMLVSSIMAVLFAAVVAFSGTHDDCKSKSSATKKSSCSTKETQSIKASENTSTEAKEVRIIQASEKSGEVSKKSHCADEAVAKQCGPKSAKLVKHTADCTEEEKAQCAVAKSGKSDCCAEKEKISESKEVQKKSTQSKSSDTKGTN